MSYLISKHAQDQLALRGISENLIMSILNDPQQIIQQIDKKIFQSVIEEDGKQYLIRIFVNYYKEPNLVITAYKTSKISKYYEGNV